MQVHQIFYGQLDCILDMELLVFVHSQPHATNLLLPCGGDSMFNWRMEWDM